MAVALRIGIAKITMVILLNRYIHRFVVDVRLLQALNYNKIISFCVPFYCDLPLFILRNS
jgi:hypothetical protein